MMKIFRPLYPVLLLLVFCFSGCTQKAPATPPSKEEVYHFFMNKMKQAATAGGYLNYRLTIDKYNQNLLTGTCTVEDETVPCFVIQIDRTEYLDNYTGSYVSIFKNDVYHLYRDNRGHLAVADYAAGQTSTEQRHRIWRGNRL